MFIDTTTGGASSGRVTRVNQRHQYSGELGLVLNKLAKLIEGPGVLLPPLTLTNRDAVSNSLEVFKGNTSTAVFGLRNNTLADAVIDMTSKASFLFGTLLEKSFRCLRIFRLKFGSKFGMPFSQPIDLSAGINLTIGVGGDIDYTQVHTEKLTGVAFRRLLNLTGLEEVKASILINQVGFATEMAEHFQLAVSGDKRYLQPAVKRPDGNKTAG